MKKFHYLSAFGLILFAMSSCKKDRTCTCNVTLKSSASTVSLVSTSTTNLKDIDSRSAKGACASYEESYQDNGATITETYDCSLN